MNELSLEYLPAPSWAVSILTILLHDSALSEHKRAHAPHNVKLDEPL